jgi:hypothetical protein
MTVIDHNKLRQFFLPWTLVSCCALAACETPAPRNDVPTADAVTEASMANDADVATVDMPTVDMPTPDAPSEDVAAGGDGGSQDADVPPSDVPSAPVCMPGATEFQPRSMAARVAPWNMCPMGVPNADTWVAFAMDINAANRVQTIDVLDRPGALFDPTRDPAPMEFINADMIFQSNGVAARFQRRPDEHYGPAPGIPLDAAYQDFCRNAANAMANRDYCAGPNFLNPVYVAGITAGMSGMPAPSRIHAARIQAAYYWWAYLSIYKESLTCAPVVADCDASFGYFSGGAARNAMTQYGLGRALLALGDPGRAAFDRIWDGLLAVRCWRDQDGGRAVPPANATNAMLREQARNQLETAITRGMALLIQARLRAFASTEGNAMRAAERQAHAAWLGVIGPLLARAIEVWVPARYPNSNAMVRARAMAALARGEMISSAEAGRTASDLEAIFPCP